MSTSATARVSAPKNRKRRGPRRLTTLGRAWRTPKGTERDASVQRAAEELRERLLSAAPVPYYEAIDLIRAPYPTRFAFREAYQGPAPYLHIVNRLFVVQFWQGASLKTLLVSPSDAQANAQTPFFERLARRFGPFREMGARLVAPEIETVETALARIGLSPESVDYITYDHLHTQDLRKWLGTPRCPAYFPNAKLLVRRAEWAAAQGLLAPQRDWYCPGGVEGIDESRIQFFDDGLELGDGVALAMTPGHTMGNHSVAVRTDEGIFVTSENGVGPDSYAPERSVVPGLAAYARDTGMDVVLNGNTLESALDQYVSMRFERTLAGPSQRLDGFCNFVPSSEFRGWWGSPGLRPTAEIGPLRFGALEAAVASKT